MAAVVPPYALCTSSQQADICGPISGSSPSWATTNFQDRGRQHADVSTVPASSSTFQGIESWYNTSGSTQRDRKLTKSIGGPVSGNYAEPVVQGAHSTYYGRRALAEHPEGYRPTRRMVQPLEHVDRPVGKKSIPEPHGAPPRLPAQRETHQPGPSASLPEPAMPRLGRPLGATILRESDQELSYERAFGRRVRVGLDTYRGSGRAGDLSLSYAPPRRPEDCPQFFTTCKDSPTFTRFVHSLPARPAVGPHQRRAEAIKRIHMAELDEERRLVASLVVDGLVDDGDDHFA